MNMKNRIIFIAFLILSILFGFITVCIGYYCMPLIFKGINVIIYAKDSVILGIEILFAIIEVIIGIVCTGLLLIITIIFGILSRMFYKKQNTN